MSKLDFNELENWNPSSACAFCGGEARIKHPSGAGNVECICVLNARIQWLRQKLSTENYMMESFRKELVEIDNLITIEGGIDRCYRGSRHDDSRPLISRVKEIIEMSKTEEKANSKSNQVTELRKKVYEVEGKYLQTILDMGECHHNIVDALIKRCKELQVELEAK